MNWKFITLQSFSQHINVLLKSKALKSSFVVVCVPIKSMKSSLDRRGARDEKVVLKVKETESWERRAKRGVREGRRLMASLKGRRCVLQERVRVCVCVCVTERGLQIERDLSWAVQSIARQHRVQGKLLLVLFRGSFIMHVLQLPDVCEETSRPNDFLISSCNHRVRAAASLRSSVWRHTSDFRTVVVWSVTTVLLPPLPSPLAFSLSSFVSFSSPWSSFS